VCENSADTQHHLIVDHQVANIGTIAANW